MLVATYMRSLQGRGNLKTLVSSGSRYSSAAAFAFFIQAVSVLAGAGCSSSGNVLLGVFAVICTGALPFCWSPNAAAFDPRIAVKRRKRVRSRWWGARFVLQAARQRISKDHTAATDVRLACCFRRC